MVYSSLGNVFWILTIWREFCTSRCSEYKKITAISHENGSQPINLENHFHWGWLKNCLYPFKVMSYSRSLSSHMKTLRRLLYQYSNMKKHHIIDCMDMEEAVVWTVSTLGVITCKSTSSDCCVKFAINITISFLCVDHMPVTITEKRDLLWLHGRSVLLPLL